MMTLKEAIIHCREIALTCNNKECAVDHFQLFKWLEDYQNILEKRSEQKPKSALEAAKEEKVDNQNCVKPADKVEPKFKIGQTIKKEGFNLGFLIVKIEDGFYYNDMGDNFPFTDQDNWELVEQKPAWSEEDEMIYQHCLTILHDYGYDTWLKSLKDRVQSQNLTIIDEEIAQAKKDTYNDALDKIEYHSGEPTFDDGWSAAIGYIQKKSLRPQNRWKPSLSQLNALGVVAKGNTPDDIEEINSLYNDLKKLKG